MNSFQSRAVLTSGNHSYTIYRLPALAARGFNLSRLPFSLKILLENLLRREDGVNVTAADIEFLANWDAKAEPSREIAYMPARVLMQDFTGVPAVVDLAAMRDAIKTLGGDPERVNPLAPAELVIDHSVQVDEFGTAGAYAANSLLEFQRNRERYAFLKWGQTAFRNFSAVPPGMGICHQVNLEYLARVVFTTEIDGESVAYPDTLVGTDSHTTMINGLGVLGWGVGGIEAEAAMLGQPVSMLVPQVVGFKLTGKLREGATATDLVLTVTQALRKLGVVGKFVEFYGPGIAELPLADRATIGNMAPEYGATCGIFPVDAETLRYLRLTGRSEDQIALVEAYYKEQGLFHTADSPEAEYTQTLSLDLATVEPSVAGPKRPQDRVLAQRRRRQLRAATAHTARAHRQAARHAHRRCLGAQRVRRHRHCDRCRRQRRPGNFLRCRQRAAPRHHHRKRALQRRSRPAISTTARSSSPPSPAAPTPPTPPSWSPPACSPKKPSKKASRVPPWVKTSLAPGSRVVTDYYQKSGLLPYLEKLRFNVVGYGCTTCIGNSGPLPADVSESIDEHGLVAVSVLSGNRNFEGRVNVDVRANYLMSPPLVVAYALAGNIGHNFDTDPLGTDPVRPARLPQRHLAHARGSRRRHRRRRQQRRLPPRVLHRLPRRRQLAGPQLPHRRCLPVGARLDLHPPGALLRRHDHDARARHRHRRRARPRRARRLRHHRPHLARRLHQGQRPGRTISRRLTASSPPTSTPTARAAAITKSWSAAPSPTCACATSSRPALKAASRACFPKAKQMSIFDASVKYAERGVPLIILAGKEYGSGSSRDWAAKGPKLLGVRAVIAESFERIHRSNLVGMGILPLQFEAGQNAESLGLTGEEIYDIAGFREQLDGKFADGRTLAVTATRPNGEKKLLRAMVRIDTPQEIEYYKHGGILQYVLRQLAAK